MSVVARNLALPNDFRNKIVAELHTEPPVLSDMNNGSVLICCKQTHDV